MPLTTGIWKANVNGSEVDLKIDAPDPQGIWAGNFANFPVRGLWDEASQMFTFAWHIDVAGVPDPNIAVFTGYLFRSPRNAAPGQDQIATLAGTVQLTVNSGGGPNQMFPGATARRNVFGWTAHITEVL